MAFLQLAVEIRQKILQEAILSTRHAPACPSVDQEGRRQVSAFALTGGGIWCKTPVNTAIPFLLINKRIHNEVQDILRRIPASYNVDIIFVKDYGLWPTWSVPVLPHTQYIDSVHATIRLFEPTDDLDSRFEGSLRFRQVCGGPPLATWAFFKLLTSVFTCGPGWYDRPEEGSFGNRIADLTPRYVVGKIVVDVVTPTDLPVHQSIHWSNKEYEAAIARSWVWSRRGDQDQPVELRMADYITDYFDRVLIMEIALDHGAIIYENLRDAIIFTVNGVEYKSYNIEEVMSERVEALFKSGFRSTPEGVERKANFKMWKKWLDERRQRMRDGQELDSVRPVKLIMNLY
jgi:hypothetical protein